MVVAVVPHLPRLTMVAAPVAGAALLLPRPTAVVTVVTAVAAAPVEAMVAVVPVAVGLAAVTAEMTLVEAARAEAATS